MVRRGQIGTVYGTVFPNGFRVDGTVMLWTYLAESLGKCTHVVNPKNLAADEIHKKASAELRGEFEEEKGRGSETQTLL